MHWSKRSELQEAWDWHVLTQKEELGLLERDPIRCCRITFEVCSVRMMDWDNLVSRFKVLGDALVHNRVLLDDSISIVRNFIPEFERVQHRTQEGCSVTIEILEQEDEPSKLSLRA